MTLLDFSSVIKATEACKMVVVDMPIGLPSGAEARACDLKAQEILGNSGRPRLFLCPPQESLGARTPVEFQACVEKLTGRKAALPVWGIVGRIKEVDSVITQTSNIASGSFIQS
jgi:predicted RNase H-like nuclease